VGSNDDHPPSDVRAGQELVLRIFNALARGPAWERTLFVIAYDEHGGFFDHVEPPTAADDDPAFRFYGARVPALVVAPRLGSRVSHDIFDHTSLIKTCLVRFCRTEKRFIPDMGARVSEARHLGLLLDTAAPAPAPSEAELQDLAARLTDWRADSLRSELAVQDGALQPEPGSLTDFQQDYLAARAEVLSSLTLEERARLAGALAGDVPVGTAGR
jgi:phospholipase C